MISNEEMNDIMKIFKSRKEAFLLIKNIVKSNWKRRKGTKRWIYWYIARYMLSGARLIGNLLTGNRVKTKIPRKKAMRAGEESIRACHGF